MLVGKGVQSTLNSLNSLCDCGSAAKCVSQNSEAQVRAAHQVSSDVPPRRDSAQHRY